MCINYIGCARPIYTSSAGRSVSVYDIISTYVCMCDLSTVLHDPTDDDSQGQNVEENTKNNNGRTVIVV